MSNGGKSLPVTRYPFHVSHRLSPITNHQSPITERTSMTGFIRRVVTGHDKNGKAVVLSDELAPSVKTNPLRPGHRSTDIWKTSAAPVPITAVEADPTLGPRQLHPAARGTIIRIAEIMPESDELRNLTPEGARKVFAAMGNEAASTFGEGGRHPMMH